jgi:Mn-dependent DtxR family transcriptional regulator
MHTYVKMLQKVATRYAPSRVLSYDMVHVFKTLQLINDKGHVSRENLCNELELGEGTVRTLIRHLKMHGLVESSNAGTKMTSKGKSFFQSFYVTSLSKCLFRNVILL